MDEVRDLVVTTNEWDVEIDWDLTVRCNYSCKYCESYDNSVPLLFKNSKEYEQALKYIKIYFGNKRIKLNILGGEPTLYKDWVNFLLVCFDQGFITKVTTNLSPSFSYLQKHLKLLPNKPCLDVSWHPSFVKDHKEMIRKIKLLKETNNLWHVSLMGDTNYWNEVIKAAEDLNNLDIKLTIARIYEEDPGRMQIRGKLWEYSQEQNDLILYYEKFRRKKDNTYKWLINNKEVAVGDKWLENKGLLNFKGMYCAVGKERMHIRPNGDCYPSACLSNYRKANMGNVFTRTLKKVKKPITCPFNMCSCGTDIRIEKHKNLKDFV